jgi:hypothetical protein
MKKYEEVGHVANPNPAKFLKDLSDLIKEYQDKGYEVEVQYTTHEKTYSALILGYKNED